MSLMHRRDVGWQLDGFNLKSETMLNIGLLRHEREEFFLDVCLLVHGLFE